MALMVAACGQSDDGADGKAADKADQTQTEQEAASRPTGPELGDWGVETDAMKPDVDAGDDFFRHVNGSWLDEYELKADEVRYGSFIKLRDRSEERVRAIIRDLAEAEPEKGTIEQKVGDYYASFMDVEALNEKGMAPIQPILDQFRAIQNREDLVSAFAKTGLHETTAPIDVSLSIDRKDPDQYRLSIVHSGLGLPNRDYYLEDTERFTRIRGSYESHIAEMLGFAGVEKEAAAKAAKDILALETRIAEHHWPVEKRRNRDLTYNPYSVEKLTSEFPDYDWNLLFSSMGIEELEEVNVSTPSAIGPLIDVIGETDLATFKAYLMYHAISGNAALLPEEVDKANFAFRGKVLSGREEQRERWKRAVNLVGSRDGLGEALGQIYVDRHFPPDSKQQMESLVENLRVALRQRVERLDWMGEDTKEEAFEKLEAFNPKIGYPDKWRGFDDVQIDPDDLFGNVLAVRSYWEREDIERLGEKTDRDEWFMTPQTVNAYYNPSFNEIVFPAAILQPPFFDPEADPAVNYGAIGAVIGHEMGHGFDDQGSKSDAKGVQRNWWTEADRERFEKRTQALVDQYDSYEPIEGETVNGRFTLGENIGDLGGLSMAYHAYKLSLGDEEAPVIDGFTGDQRFFMAWAQVWRGKNREQYMLRRLKSDPHSPEEFRVNGVVRNMDAWYTAFDVDKDDDLYLAPEERVSIW
ncbi:M13 family metallopeptidase [Yunchengibacter salinarum]|uniref:M13 family metallopeptidase n=1 Tax=Yunchengibacter salinarum TaxID=3133399 RepID=UPI0035B60816